MSFMVIDKRGDKRGKEKESFKKLELPSEEGIQISVPDFEKSQGRVDIIEILPGKFFGGPSFRGKISKKKEE